MTHRSTLARLPLGILGCLALSALSLGARAQCHTSTGPDVVVGDLTGPANYAAVGNVEVVSFGTVACNIGNAAVLWIPVSNQHPVIAGNLYRFRVSAGAGRFEQIGMSWLKHGFFAESQTLCCSGCQTTDGTTLGVDCSDPYSAATNAAQSGLGPRWQVDPHTGVFPYPPANPPWSGGIARRLQVSTSDLTATGAGVTTRYFGEAQYVTPDDAAAGNQNNNASWREVSVSGSNVAWNFGYIGSTQKTKSAIRAWPLCENGVTLRDVQVQDDGLFVVGFKATDMQNGTWHYEYAVANMNSNRAGGSFSVPVSAGATITNIGFHDVAYHDGDGSGSVDQSGADWTSSVAGGAVTWTCETEAANTNANALRWSSTYNFRFDADVAPAAGNATLGLWRTGSPASMSVGVDVPGVPTGPVSFAYCFGDGSGTACPCGNNSSAGSQAGCQNSLGTGGALSASGSASLGADALVLGGSGMPDGPTLYFQGTTQVAGGAGTLFGDGLLCAGGTTTRLGIEFNVSGASHYPDSGQSAVSVQGAIGAPGVRVYQGWYRNSAAFCQPEGFNLTNAFQVAWTP